VLLYDEESKLPMSAPCGYESNGGIGVDFWYFIFLVQLVARGWDILLVRFENRSILGI